jgi:hypothetical protein
MTLLATFPECDLADFVDAVISNPEAAEKEITPGFCGTVLALLTRALEDEDIIVVSQAARLVGFLLRLDWPLKESFLSAMFPILVKVLFLDSPEVHPNSLDAISHIIVERVGLAPRGIFERCLELHLAAHAIDAEGSNPGSSFEDKARAIRFVQNLTVIVCPVGLEGLLTPERFDVVFGFLMDGGSSQFWSSLPRLISIARQLRDDLSQIVLFLTEGEYEGPDEIRELVLGMLDEDSSP